MRLRCHFSTPVTPPPQVGHVVAPLDLPRAHETRQVHIAVPQVGKAERTLFELAEDSLSNVIDRTGEVPRAAELAERNREIGGDVTAPIDQDGTVHQFFLDQQGLPPVDGFLLFVNYDVHEFDYTTGKKLVHSVGIEPTIHVLETRALGR